MPEGGKGGSKASWIVPSLVGCSGCSVPLLIAVIASLVFVAALPAAIKDTSNGTTDDGGGGPISGKIPPGWKEILQFAEQKTGVPAAEIGGMFLTEVHSDNLGADVTPTDTRNCTSNGSGARGPMQIIPSTWVGYRDSLRGAGAPPEVYNSPVAPCDYHWGMVAGGFVIRGKASAGNVNLTSLNEVGVKTIAGLYCGNRCNYDTNCDRPGYIYCEQAWRHYQIMVGSSKIAYLPPPIALAMDTTVCGKGLI